MRYALIGTYVGAAIVLAAVSTAANAIITPTEPHASRIDISRTLAAFRPSVDKCVIDRCPTRSGLARESCIKQCISENPK
jgi:hypothetical protein